MTARLELKSIKSNAVFNGDGILEMTRNVRITEMNGKYGLITNANSLVCPCEYDEIVAIGEGYYKMRTGTHWGVMNSYGIVCCPCRYFKIIGLADGGVYCEIDDDVFYIKFAA